MREAAAAGMEVAMSQGRAAGFKALGIPMLRPARGVRPGGRSLKKGSSFWELFSRKKERSSPKFGPPPFGGETRERNLGLTTVWRPFEAF